MALFTATAALGPVLFVAGVVGARPAAEPPPRPDDHTVTLAEGWAIQAAETCDATGESISRPGFRTPGWRATTVPSTVLGALVDQGVYGDPFFGKNLERIAAAPFQRAWWYRTEFALAPASAERRTRLVFEGINFSAHVWLNGRKIADRAETRGAFRIFSLDVSDAVRPGLNGLAVEVFPPQPGDFTIGFVDWNPSPPDRNMGLWRPVLLRRADPVFVDEVSVESVLDATLASADLVVAATIENRGRAPIAATLSGRIAEITFSRSVALGVGERRRVTFSAAEFPRLRLERPRLWWPNNLGEPHLYKLELNATVDGHESDRQEVAFGVRSVSDYVDPQGHRGYRINGQPLLIRGAGWVDDLFLREDPRRLEAQIAYARHMNLNTLRLEGLWGSSQRLYDLADRYGILLMAGWSCQWEWQNYLGKTVDEQYGGVNSPEDRALVASYFRDQVVWLRNHPSLFVWVVGSDMLPRPELERAYRALLAELDPGRPLLAACAARTSEVSGPTGVKMNGPYDYVTPNYWYLDSERGGAFGFNTETGPGPQIPPLASLKHMMPAEQLWPLGEVWDYHCGRNEFNTLARYLKAFDARYGAARGAEELARKAQLANYEAVRAMFEAFAVHRARTTGVIQWMFNAAWPKLYWQLFGYDLMPNGAYYGTRKACQPQSLAYDYGRREVHAVNGGRQPLRGATAEVRVFDLNSRLVFERTQAVDVPADSAAKVMDLPTIANVTPVYFLDLRLKDGTGATITSNLYWLSTAPDVLDFGASTWFYTPNSAYADFTALARLPIVNLDAVQATTQRDRVTAVQVTLRNRSSSLAFFVELQLVGDRSGRTLLPVLWEDNYVTLLPGEERKLTATVGAVALGGEQPRVRYSGWNVKESGIPTP